MWVSFLMLVNKTGKKERRKRASRNKSCVVRQKKKSCCKQRVQMSFVSLWKSSAAVYCRAADCNASSKGSKSSGRLLGFCENYGNAGEMDEQHFITINQRLLINKVRFLFSMIQGIIKRTLSLSLWLTNPSSLWEGGRAEGRRFLSAIK